MSEEDSGPGRDARTRRTLWLWGLAGAAFATAVLGYSGAMIFLAQRDYPGSVVNDYFENYKRFNQHTRQLEDQRSLGWNLSTDIASLPVVGEPLRVKVLARDDQGRRLTGAEVRVRFVRSINARQDRRVRLAESEGGRYAGTVRIPAPGNWDVYTTVRKNGQRYTARRFLWVEGSLE